MSSSGLKSSSPSAVLNFSDTLLNSTAIETAFVTDLPLELITVTEKLRSVSS